MYRERDRVKVRNYTFLRTKSLMAPFLCRHYTILNCTKERRVPRKIKIYKDKLSKEVKQLTNKKKKKNTK